MVNVAIQRPDAAAAVRAPAPEGHSEALLRTLRHCCIERDPGESL